MNELKHERVNKKNSIKGVILLFRQDNTYVNFIVYERIITTAFIPGKSIPGQCWPVAYSDCSLCAAFTEGTQGVERSA